MLSRLSLTDFKAFHKQELRLRPITILIGPNNSGKSSLVTALRLLAQTVQSRDPGLPLLLDGAFGDFGAYRDLVHGNYRGRPIGLTLAISDGTQKFELALEYKYRTVRRELALRTAELVANNRPLLQVSATKDYSRHLVVRLGQRPVPTGHRSVLSRLLEIYNFIPRFQYRPSRQTGIAIKSLMSEAEFERLDDEIDDAAYAMRQTLNAVDYIGAMRRSPERTYYQTGTAGAKIGRHGENWPGLFFLDSSRPSGDREIVPAVTSWLRAAGLAADVRLHYLSDRHYEFQVRHPSTGEYENLADVGQANSQIIPILVGGFRMATGSTYLVEEPEIHLHPHAQAELGDFFLDLYRRGVSSVVETHSEYLILRLQQHIAAGHIEPRSIAFYYVYAWGEKKRVRQLRVDAEGRFDRPLDQGFFPQRLAESRNLALIRQKRRATGAPPHH